MAVNAPTVVLQSAQTTSASNSFAGLTPGNVYVAQVNAVGSAGPSDWSEPVSQMVVKGFAVNKNSRNVQSFRLFT